MFSLLKIYTVYYKIRFFLKKLFFKSKKKDLIILQKIIKLSYKKNIKLKNFLYLLKKELPNYIFDEKILIFFFQKKRGIKKKNFFSEIKNTNDYQKLYFFYKLFILKGWLCESYAIRKFLVNFKFKKNKNIIEKISDKTKIYSFLNSKNKKLKNFDHNLLNIIKDKNIAVVGPADNKEKNGEEIDKFDLVVRINQLSKENLNLKKGYKTDIIFVNGIKCDTAILENKLKFIKKAKILFVKNYSYKKLFKKIGFNNVKVNSNIDNYLAIGIANMLPFILFELLKYKPKKIKIFDNDLMLNPRRIKNYQKYSNYRSKDFLRMCINHDPISQFNFIRYLYKNSKIITGDKNFLTAIKYSEIHYLKKLEKNYMLDKLK